MICIIMFLMTSYANHQLLSSFSFSFQFTATISRTGTLAVQGRFTVKGRKDTKAKVS